MSLPGEKYYKIKTFYYKKITRIQNTYSCFESSLYIIRQSSNWSPSNKIPVSSLLLCIFFSTRTNYWILIFNYHQSVNASVNRKISSIALSVICRKTGKLKFFNVMRYTFRDQSAGAAFPGSTPVYYTGEAGLFHCIIQYYMCWYLWTPKTFTRGNLWTYLEPFIKSANFRLVTEL